MASIVEHSTDTHSPGGVGLRHVPWVITRPAELFSRAEDTGAYGPALVVLLGLLVLVGYVEIQSGLIDRVVDLQTESQLAELELQQYGLVDKLELKDQMDAVRKNGEFMKMIRRLGAVVISPIWMLVSILFIGAILYAAVALCGRKPEYHTLLTICVYAGYVVLAGEFLRVGMMLAYKTTQLDTTLRMLAEPGRPTPWAAVDPFRIWFWILVVTGVIVTRQLSRRAAFVTCGSCFVLATSARVGLEYLGA